jgi:hypothetical protein
VLIQVYVTALGTVNQDMISDTGSNLYCWPLFLNIYVQDRIYVKDYHKYTVYNGQCICAPLDMDRFHKVMCEWC